MYAAILKLFYFEKTNMSSLMRMKGKKEFPITNCYCSVSLSNCMSTYDIDSVVNILLSAFEQA